MSHVEHLTVLAGASTIALAIGAPAAAGPNDEVHRQIEQLQAANAALARKVESLERAASGDQWLTEERAAEIRAIVGDVLADAGTRASLQSSGMTGGWNKDQGGFFLASPSGDFKLNIKGQVQVRWAWSQRDNDGLGATPAREDSWGFENRRTKLTFAGFVVDPSWTFEVKPVYSRSTSVSGNLVGSVEDIWVQKDLGTGIAVRAGQFKAPFLREELVSSSSQLAVERSLVSDVFTTKFGQGVQVEFGGRAGDQWRAQLYYGDGLRANATSVPASSTAAAGGFAGSYTTGFNGNPVDYAFAGRLEYLGQGTWKLMRDFNSAIGEERAWMVGIGGMAQSLRPANEGPVAPGTTNSMWGVTADATFNFGGASLFAYGVYRQVMLQQGVAVRGGGLSDSMDQWGAVVQAGYYLNPEVELFARYELGNTDTDQFRVAEPGIEYETSNILTLGVNYFFGGAKDVRWTTDVGYAFSPVGDFNSSGADWLQDGTSTTDNGFANDGEIVVRTQMQLLF